MTKEGASFLQRSKEWIASKLNPVNISKELAPNNAAQDDVRRKTPIPGTGQTLWQMTDWSNSLPDEERTNRLKIIYDREAATHRIIQEKINDIFRGGKEIEADDGIIKTIEDFEVNTLFIERLRESLYCAMWQGNGYLERLFAGDAKNTIEQPPPPGAEIMGYRVIDATRCRPVVDTDMKSKTYDKVLYYKLTFANSALPPLKGHPDRILHIVLNPDPMAEDHLGKSEIEAIYDAALNKRVADTDMVQLIHRKAGMIYHFTVKGAQDEDIESYQKEYGNMTNVTNLVTGEDVTIEGVGGDGAIANIEAYLRYYEDQICYGLRYPVSLFRGEGQGSISTADTNLLSYHEHIKSYQQKVTQILEKEYDIVLNKYQIVAAEAQPNMQYEIIWKALGEKDKQRDANIRFSESQAFMNMINGGLDAKAALALVGWDKDLEDMDIVPEEMVSGASDKSPGISPAAQFPPSPPNPGIPPQATMEEPKMSRADARAVIKRRGPKDMNKYINGLRAGLGVAIVDLGRIVAGRLNEGMTPEDVQLMRIAETKSHSPVENLFLRAMVSNVQNAFMHGYRAGREDLGEVKTGKKKLMPKMADKEPTKPEDIEIPPEWWTIYPKEDIEFLRAYVFNFAIERGREFEDVLKDIIIADLEKGTSIPEIRKDIMTEAADMSGYEAERIARTEVLRAANEGRLRAYHAEGVGRVEFVAADDERTCPECNAEDGKELTLAEAGGLLPLHPQCRCTYIPIP
jgi:SPP1 gp7 family putative phage head morphogenesis protein